MALQVSSGSQREKWVAAFIPSVAILAITFFYFTFYASAELKKVEGQYQSAVNSGIGPDVVSDLNATASQLRKDRTDLQNTIRSVEKEVKTKSGEFQAFSPIAKHRAVIELCRRHGVAVLLDKAVDDIRLPDLRSESVETLQSLIPADATGFRELTVAADYGTIVRLLQELPEFPGVIPVSVKLDKKEVGDSSDDSARPSVSWTVGLLM